VRPVVLPPNAVPRFYRGGPAMAAFRGSEPVGDRVPEDWVGSMTTVFGEEELGLSHLPDGRLLRDAAAADPVAYFGPEHAARHGADPAMLVKLLDAGERLPVHVHPNGPFAHEVLGSPYGKTEAWIVVATARSDASVGVGFRDDVSAETLADWVRDQDGRAMLDALNSITVRAGDAIFVPAGVPHVIGEGLLIVEVQEPSDLSVLLEWRGFGTEDADEATLGLGWEAALGCVELAGRGPPQLGGARGNGDGTVTSLLPATADRFFRTERIAPSPAATLERGFAILVVVEGSGSLHCGNGDPIQLRRGDAVLVPWVAGECQLEGELVAIACRPPAPDERGAP
jgi:mannose-6-phosphate isomerase